MQSKAGNIRHRAVAVSGLPKYAPKPDSAKNKSRRPIKNVHKFMAISLFLTGIAFLISRRGELRSLPNIVERAETGISTLFSSGDTIIGIGSDYDISTYHQFVDSTRQSGFKGNIILGMRDTQNLAGSRSKAEILSYLQDQGVIVKDIGTVKCINDHDATCLDINPNMKPAWAHYVLAREWLRECKSCNGSILITKVQSSIFKSVPFSSFETIEGGLHLFETPFNIEDENVALSLKQCKNFEWDVPLLSSSIAIGDRMTIFFFLEILINELYEWNRKEDCRSIAEGDETAIINYLFYNGDFRANVHDLSSGIH